MSEEPEAEQADEADATESEEEVEQQEGLQEGDFVRLDYTARTEDGQLVDTTDPEVAEEEGVADEDQTFEPRVVVLGEGHIFAAVEDDIYGKEVGDSGSVTVPAEEAFGERDDEEVRTVSAEKIPEDERYPGAHVNVDGEHGHVETIIGGRARVDFNHPLAGEAVEYEYEVLDEVEDRIERAQGLIGMYVDVDLDMWIETDEEEEEVRVDDEDDEDSEPEFETETVEKETLYIESTPQLAMNQQWMMSKQQVAMDVVDRLDLDRIIVQETLGEGPGMMGGMGGMMGGGMGGGDLEDALDDADVDADEIVDELEDAQE
jgi:FKBP-type peptidyl-prolyl cis-trans isomerase SlyD